MFARRAAKRASLMATVIALAVLLLSSPASASHNGGWDPTANRYCWWRLPSDYPLSASTVDTMEHQTIDYVNDARMIYGLPPLQNTSCISMAASMHSGDQIWYRQPQQHVINGLNWPDRLRNAGVNFIASGENVSCQYGTYSWSYLASIFPYGTVWGDHGWMYSPDHYKNILSMNGQWNYAGLGIAAGYIGGWKYICVTQDFVRTV